jgi:hypothetical protein
MLCQILPYENILIPSSFLSPSPPEASRFYAWWIGFRHLQMFLNPYLFLASEDGKGARRIFVTGAFHASVAESNPFQF